MKVNSPYFLYMAEAEGMTGIVNTREAKLNKAIKMLNNYSGTITKSVFRRILMQCDLNEYELTQREINRIYDEVK